MDNDRIIELISSQGTKLDVLSSILAKLDERMTKLEALREQDIKQNEKIEQILTRLEEGSKHFEKIDSRLTSLETAAGKNAKELLHQIASIFIATVMGAVIGNAANIVAYLSSK